MYAYLLALFLILAVVIGFLWMLSTKTADSKRADSTLPPGHPDKPTLLTGEEFVEQHPSAPLEEKVR